MIPNSWANPETYAVEYHGACPRCSQMVCWIGRLLWSTQGQSWVVQVEPQCDCPEEEHTREDGVHEQLELGLTR